MPNAGRTGTRSRRERKASTADRSESDPMITTPPRWAYYTGSPSRAVAFVVETPPVEGRRGCTATDRCVGCSSGPGAGLSMGRRAIHQPHTRPGAGRAAGTPCGSAGCGRSGAGSVARRGPAGSGRMRTPARPRRASAPGSCCCSSWTRAAGIDALQHVRPPRHLLGLRRRAAAGPARAAPRRRCPPGARGGSGGSARRPRCRPARSAPISTSGVSLRKSAGSTARLDGGLGKA